MESIFENAESLTESLNNEVLDKAKNHALGYLAARMRTRHEVAAYLYKKNYADDVVQEVLAFLERYQYLDDAAYCRAWIYDKLQFHPCGRKKLAAELSKKVADRQLVQVSIESYYSVEQELEYAQTAAMQKMNSRTGAKQITRQQLARFLYSRGYGSNIIESVLSSIDFSASPEEF